MAAYVEGLQKELAAPSVKQHLAAIRRLFDYLATGGVLPSNPASSVRGPKHVVKVGKTPVLSEEEARTLFDSIDTGTVVGLRDRAFLAVMTYSFARVGAVVKMEVKDYYTQGKRSWFRLHEKGGKYHQVPVHHRAGEYVDAYLEAAGILAEARSPLFRTSLARTGRLTANALTENAALRIVKRRAAAAGLPREICCHTFRATGITSFLLNGGEAQQGPEDRQPRVPAHDRALQPHPGRGDARRDRADPDLNTFERRPVRGSGLIEQWGSGVQPMTAVCRDARHEAASRLHSSFSAG